MKLMHAHHFMPSMHTCRTNKNLTDDEQQMITSHWPQYYYQIQFKSIHNLLIICYSKAPFLAPKLIYWNNGFNHVCMHVYTCTCLCGALNARHAVFTVKNWFHNKHTHTHTHKLIGHYYSKLHWWWWRRCWGAIADAASAQKW